MSENKRPDSGVRTILIAAAIIVALLAIWVGSAEYFADELSWQID